jgi:hypothetical protein
MSSYCSRVKKVTIQRFYTVLLIWAVSVPVFGAVSDAKAPSSKPNRRIHAVSDLGHQFSFYADGRFHKQYLPGQPVATNWGALYNFDFSDANLLILLGCDLHVKYLPKDLETIRQFLADGGGVVLMASAGDNPQNKLASQLGCTFQGRAKSPLKGIGEHMNEIEGHADWMEIKEPDLWNVLITDADGKTVLASKKVGKGMLLIGARQLAGSRPDAKDDINAAWWKPLLARAASGKMVDSKKPFRSRGIGDLAYTDNLGNIKLSYSEYLKPYAKAMGDIYLRTAPVIEKRMGVPLSEGMASHIGLLATGDGGFSSGRTLGLAVFWGGFPEREDSMIEFITHESVHSWVLPFAEIWNEPIATYVGDLVMADMGYEEEGFKRINNTIERAKRIDPTMKLYDISGKSLTGAEPLTGGQANEMHWGKTFWIFEELRKENPDILADYFRAKRRLANPAQIKKYDTNATVAVLSIAMERDMFGWFREHGFDVSRDNSPVEFGL